MFHFREFLECKDLKEQLIYTIGTFSCNKHSAHLSPNLFICGCKATVWAAWRGLLRHSLLINRKREWLAESKYCRFVDCPKARFAFLGRETRKRALPFHGTEPTRNGLAQVYLFAPCGYPALA